MKTIFKISKILHEKLRAKKRFSSLRDILVPYLKGNKTVLDFGSADGRLANDINKKLKIKITAIDKYPQPKKFMPVMKYDGEKLPFRNNSFDCVMIIDVLHHTKDQQKIIKEAKRVSKKYVLIKDHYWNNKIDFLLLKYSDYIANRPYDIVLNYNFFNMEMWYKLIDKIGLSIVESKKFKYSFWDPCKHIIFKLKK